MPGITVLGREQDRRIMGAQETSNQVPLVTSKHSEIFCLKNIGERTIKENK